MTPFLGQLIRIGEHVSLETWTGPQFTIGPRQTDQFIYGASLGYNIPHRQFRVPLVDLTTPIFELDGQTPFTGTKQDVLFGVAGACLEFRQIGPAQPQLQVGHQFPIDRGGRDRLQWGIVAELHLQF